MTPFGGREEEIREVILRALEAPCASGALRAEWLARDLAEMFEGVVSDAEANVEDLQNKIDELEEELEERIASHRHACVELDVYRDGVARVLGQDVYDVADDAISDLVSMVAHLTEARGE